MEEQKTIDEAATTTAATTESTATPTTSPATENQSGLTDAAEPSDAEKVKALTEELSSKQKEIDELAMKLKLAEGQNEILAAAQKSLDDLKLQFAAALKETADVKAAAEKAATESATKLSELENKISELTANAKTAEQIAAQRYGAFAATSPISVAQSTSRDALRQKFDALASDPMARARWISSLTPAEISTLASSAPAQK